jgi:hypothetical protein
MDVGGLWQSNRHLFVSYSEIETFNHISANYIVIPKILVFFFVVVIPPHKAISELFSHCCLLRKLLSMMDIANKEKFHEEMEKARKVYECYRFLAMSAGGNQVLRKKIDALAEEHLLALSP